MSKEYDGRKELAGIVLFFCAIILALILYLPSEVTGFLGEKLKMLSCGLIGYVAYSFPLFVLYSAFDFFFEKRKNVARNRVRNVIIILICVSVLLSLGSYDFEYIRSLCSDGLEGKIKATKAISLMWRSGVDPTLISNPAGSSNAIPGGILGGLIAIALYSVVQKAISIIAVIVMILAMVIHMFQISLKTAAKTTATTIKKAVANRPRPASYYGNGSTGRGSGYRGSRSNDARYVYRNSSNRQPSQRTPFVNSPTDISNVPLMDVEYDPFNVGMPVDRKSGFVDVSGKEFGVEQDPSGDYLNYGTKKVSTKGADEAPTADFGYTPTPRTHAPRPRKDYKDPSFLINDKGQKDFYDLDDSVYPNGTNAPFGASTITGDDPSETDGELPYDMLEQYAETIPYNAGSYSEDDLPSEVEDYQEIERTVRRSPSNIDLGHNGQGGSSVFVAPGNGSIVTSAVAAGGAAASASSIPGAPDNPAGAVPINADNGDELREGRIVETAPDNGAPVGTSAIYDAPAAKKKDIGHYVPPPKNILSAPVQTKEQIKEQQANLAKRAHELEETLKSFGIPSKVINITHGPAITRFEITIEKGIKVSRVMSLQDDIAMSMAAVSVRIEAPIPGKSAIGIEIPNNKVSAVQLRGLLDTPEFKNAKPLEVPLGRDIPNRPIMCDIAKMPHLLIAGSTGSGKSVCINTILTSILYHSSPDEVKMILIDPKVVELSIYNGIPHLFMPVVTDPKKAANALKWAVIEMEKRYKLFAENSVRDLAGYNDLLEFNGEKKLPLILIVIDELADLMTVASKEVEVQISRLAAMARAAGLHLIIATQRPSVDVLTGVIKANIPSRIAFAVSAGPDSRTILDSVGAEKLLGKGDMLYAPISAPKPLRGQGAFLTDKEVEGVVSYLKNKYGPYYDETIMKLINSGIDDGSSSSSGSDGDTSDEDELLDDAVNTVIEAGSASVSILQRRLGVGYPRAGKLIDALEKMHVIGPFEGSKPRKVLLTKTEWLEIRAKQKGG